MEQESHIKKKYFFNHLNEVDQDYWAHFRDSIKYCGMSLKSAFFFFIHSMWPDLFIKNGSETILELSNIITEKYNEINTRQNNVNNI